MNKVGIESRERRLAAAKGSRTRTGKKAGHHMKVPPTKSCWGRGLGARHDEKKSLEVVGQESVHVCGGVIVLGSRKVVGLSRVGLDNATVWPV